MIKKKLYFVDSIVVYKADYTSVSSLRQKKKKWTKKTDFHGLPHLCNTALF